WLGAPVNSSAPRGTLRRTGYDSFVPGLPGHSLAQASFPVLARFESVPNEAMFWFVLDCFG
ncbi:hypothetical protein PoMZ_00413, partial [Pyricularia oryzae]